MSLTPGTRLGSYEVLTKLGEGGMGEVYRARDTKLDRDVALKILPEVFAGDADRLARFEREAKTLALLNHPNIAHVYDAGTSQSIAYLAMELVEGDDLSTLINRGSPEAESGSSRAPRGLSLDDSVSIAKQLTDALEAAHELGVVHRDLKPANIKIRPDGTVKVLDFGLAKALDQNASGAAAEAMNSPTLTARATQMGMIIGTAAYMAPEQARGRAVDRRADIWAFGVVLYEMLTGKRAFDGEDVSITLAGVLKEDVRWDALAADTPLALQKLLRRCLEKDPKRRLGWIGEARLMLEDPTAVVGGLQAAEAGGLKPAGYAWFPWTAAALGLGAAVVSVALWSPWRAAPAPAPVRLLSHIGADASLSLTRGSGAILSPDGTTLAFVALKDGQARLFIRKLDQLVATAMAGTEGADQPFFSPQGDWIAFFASGQLKKVPVNGGAPKKICDVTQMRGGTWSDDGTIIYTPAATANTKLMRVSAEGGKPSEFGTFGEGAVTQRWPQALPGGAHVLYVENSSGANFDGANIVVAPLAGGSPKIVMKGAYAAVYVPASTEGTLRRGKPGSEGGHLLYVQQGVVFAVPFDLGRLETIGQGVVAVEGVAASSSFGSANFAVSSTGTLVYAPGAADQAARSIDWVSRDGKVTVLRADKADWAEPRFSPDGQKLAMILNDGNQRHVWVYDMKTERMTQLTFDGRRDRTPVWSRDNKRIVFSSDRANPGGPLNLYWTNADGTGTPTRLTNSPNTQTAFSWHPDLKHILFQEARPNTGTDLMVLPVEGNAVQGWKPGTPTVFFSTLVADVYPQVSPDGLWVAYFSVVGGSTDVWVRPFSGSEGQWRVSEGGGVFPKWSPTSKELMFLDRPTGQIKVAPYSVVGGSFQPGKVVTWSPTLLRNPIASEDSFAFHPDGKRVATSAIVNKGVAVADKVVFVFNFAEYLNTIAPVKK